jgi:hypothetical protein
MDKFLEQSLVAIINKPFVSWASALERKEVDKAPVIQKCA